MTEPVDRTSTVHHPSGADTGPADPHSTPDAGSAPDPQTAPDQGPGTEPASGTVAQRPGAGPPGRPSFGWTELAAGVVSYLLLAGLALPLAVILIFGIPGPDDPLAVPTLAAVGLGSLGAAVVALAVRVRWWPALGLRPTTLRWLLIGVGAGLLAKVVGTGLSFGYTALTGDMSNPQESIAGAAAGSGLELVGVLVFGALLVPIGEELLFRGVGYGALRGFGYGRLARYGLWIATVLSALLFGFAHGVNLVLPAALILGVVNAVLYERSRSIWPAIASHVTFNASAFLLAALIL